MEKKDLLKPENEKLKIAFVFGAVLYEELTEERTKPISKEQAETLTDEQIELIFLYTQIENIDFVNDIIACDSVLNCSSVLVDRHPPQKSTEESLREFKAKYKEFFTE